MSVLPILVSLVDSKRVPALTALCDSFQQPQHVTVMDDGPQTPTGQLVNRKQSTASLISPLNIHSPTKSDAGTMVSMTTAPPNLTYARGVLVEVPEEPHLKALHLVAQANQMLDGGLHRCKEWVTVKDMYFQAAAYFSSSDLHREAGDTFNHSAAICRVYGSDLEVANAASFAVESYRLADPILCNPLLEELVEIYTKTGRIGLVAKYQFELAKNCDQLGMLPEALDQYLAAIESFDKSAKVERGQAGKGGLRQQCKVKAARLSSLLGKYRESAALFEQLAKEVVGRGLGPTQYYFAAVLCWFADSSGEHFASGLAKTKQRFLDYQDEDAHFQKGVENQFIKGLLASFDKPSLSAFDSAVRQYWSMRPQDDWIGHMIAQTRDNLFQYLLPFM